MDSTEAATVNMVGRDGRWQHHVALLVSLSGPLHLVVDRRGLAGSEEDHL